MGWMKERMECEGDEHKEHPDMTRPYQDGRHLPPPPIDLIEPKERRKGERMSQRYMMYGYLYRYMHRDLRATEKGQR